MRGQWLWVLAAAVLPAACGPTEGNAHVEVEDAWVRLPAVPGRPAAAYFHIRTDVGPATLVRVEAPQAARAEMHESMARGGMTTMAPLARVLIAADSAEAFAPGGRHVMLYGLTPAVKRGGTTPLRLFFADDPTPATVNAEVVGPADPAP